MNNKNKTVNLGYQLGIMIIKFIVITNFKMKIIMGIMLIK